MGDILQSTGIVVPHKTSGVLILEMPNGGLSSKVRWRQLLYVEVEQIPMANTKTANLDRAAEVSYQYWLNPFAPRLHVRCDDPEELCPCVPGEGVTVAYTIDNQPDINFCPRYFQKLSLDAALRLKDPAKEGDISFWNNRGKRTALLSLTRARQVLTVQQRKTGPTS